MHNWELFVSLLNTKLFCAEAKVTLAEFGRTRQYLGEDLYSYVLKFKGKALDCCHLVAKDVLVDVCLYGMIEEYSIYKKICLFLPSPS